MNRDALAAGAGRAALVTLVLGALSTLGDWIWARWIPDGAVLPGVLHGLVFFLAIAVLFGWAVGNRRVLLRLLVSLPLVGLALAAVFYPLAALLGYLGALLATWAGMWLALALLLRWAIGEKHSLGMTFAQGLLAAVGSGLAFWAVSGMWTNPSAYASYPTRLVYWSLAFLPGVLAILLAPAGESSKHR